MVTPAYLSARNKYKAEREEKSSKDSEQLKKENVSAILAVGISYDTAAKELL